jgi:signal transduction histidine kinase
MTEPSNDAALQEATLAALRSHLFANRGMLPPAQLRQIAAEILQISGPEPPPAGLGQRLNQRGLAFVSLMHVGMAIIRTLLLLQQVERAQITTERLELVLQEYQQANLQRIHAEQERMQQAVQEAIAASNRETRQLQREIDQRRQVEELLQRDKAAAEAANRAKSTFLANMSHELRTPLNAILGYAQILQLQSVANGNDTILPTLTKIRTAGNHLLAIISDILDLSKIEADKFQLFSETFDITELVHELLITATPLVEKQGNAFVTNLPTALGTMHADLARVRQVLLNLLSNAAKFTQQGTVTLSVRREQVGLSDWIVYMVCDTGVGISDEDRKLLFKPFSQVNTAAMRKRGGTGLGLAISHHLCRMMGGDIAVVSKPGEGSTFTVRLPAMPLNGSG